MYFILKKDSGLILFNKSHKALRGLWRYRLWRAKNEPKPHQLRQQCEFRFNYAPKISIIIPTYNTPIAYLKQAIKSVLSQTYSNWELCIVDGASQDSRVKSILRNYEKKDSRIRLHFLKQNKGISGNCNEAIKLVSGEFVTVLDHDDLIAPFALYEIISAINEKYDVTIIYSDEDKITANRSIRFNPFFKPDFSPDTLRSHNYICHLLVIRKNLGDEIGWFRDGLDGSQDYDLILRATEYSRKVIHVPKILYHWRVNPGSVAGNELAKIYAYDAAKKALKEHLMRSGMNGKVEDGAFRGSYEITYSRNLDPKVSIIIPNYDHVNYLKDCICSVLNRSSYTNMEILVIENNSIREETFYCYKELRRKQYIRIIEWKEKFNYSKVNNFAAQYARGEVLLFLNNDTEVINADWIERMLEFSMREDVGAVGSKLLYPNDTIQHAGIVVGMGNVAGHPHQNEPIHSKGYFGRLQIIHNVSAVTGACLMIRKEAFKRIGGFDPILSLAYGDVDLCLKLREAGYLNVWTPYARLYHHESQTRGYEDTAKKKMRLAKEAEYFKSKWLAVIKNGDPYYNPNLSLTSDDFSIKSSTIDVGEIDAKKWSEL